MGEIDAKLKRMPRTVRVGIVAGGLSEFITIQAAITWCATQAVPVPSAANRYTVEVWPGTYNEQITLAQYVDVVGIDKESVIIPVDSLTAVTMAEGCRIANLTINVLADGASAYGIDLNDAACRVEDINIYLDRVASVEAVGIIEDADNTVKDIYIRNVRIRTNLVTNSNTRGIVIRQDNKTVYLEESYVQASDYGLAIGNSGGGAVASVIWSKQNFFFATSAASRAVFCNGGEIWCHEDSINRGCRFLRENDGLIIYTDGNEIYHVFEGMSIQDTLDNIPAVGCTIRVHDGPYPITDPITFTQNGTTLQGDGFNTLINGDGLATGEHAIVISGVTHCTVKNLAIQTEDGGGKTCHCIFIEDGASQTEIDNVHIVDSDSDGIHIEGTSMFDVHIHNCHIDDADDHGIYALMDANHHLQRLCIKDNEILGTGLEGIQIDDPTGTGANEYTQIIGNLIYQAGEDGIEVSELNFSKILGNVVLDCTLVGIHVVNSIETQVSENVCWSNVTDGIEIAGTSVSVLVSNNVCCNNGSAGAFAGIDVGTVSGCHVQGNHCCSNQQYGIIAGVAAGGNNHIIGNYCADNYREGIADAGQDNLIEGNFIYDNGQEGAGTYHGIILTNNCIRGSVIGNYILSPGDSQEDGIHLEDGATQILIKGNYCYNGMGAGIALAANNVDCHIEGNYVYLNDDAGIEVLAGCQRTVINDNHCIQNGLHGITLGSTDCQINDNYIFDTGQTGAGTYHGIYLAGGADRCQISGNHITDPGDSTEDGIHLADGAVEAMINNNYIYNLMGDGILLAGNNLDCQIVGNQCNQCDDYGIWVFDESDRCVVTGNKCFQNGEDGIRILESDYCTVTGNVCNDNSGDGIHVAGDATHEANYNTLTGNTCTGNTGDGIELSEVGAGDCTKSIVIGNQLLGNGAALTDGGTNTEKAHNIVA